MANTKITTDALADGAITSAKLGSGAVNTQVASYLSSNSFVDTTALNSAVSTAVSNLVGSAPSTLDTLEELATSIGNSATLSSTLTSSIATKLPLAGGTLTGDLILGDSIKLELGAGTGGDLQLYHDGSHSYVTNTYASGALKLVSDDFRIENASNRNQLKTGVSGAVQLFFDDGSATGLRLGTTAAGVDVTGNIVVSGTVDGVDIATRDAILTSTTTTAGAALPKAGGTMTGNLAINTGSPELYFGTTGNHYNWRIAAQELVDAGFEIAVGSQDTDYSNDTYVNKFVVKASGNVGIGTDNPPNILSVRKTTTAYEDVISIIGQNSPTDIMGALAYDQATDLMIIRNDQTHATGGIAFRAGGTANHLFIETGGQVGIGTDSPASPLHVKKTGSTSAVQEFLRLENHALGGVGAGSSINFHHYHAGSGPTGGAKAASITAQNMATWPAGTPSSYSSGLTFGTLHENTFAERMRIGSNGNLELAYAGATRQQADSQALSIITPATGGGQGIAFKRLDSNNDQGLGEISWSNNTQDGQANIRVKTAGAVNSTDMHFDVNNAGTLVTAMSIDGSAGGNVGIGTISPRSPLHVAGNIELNSESTATSGDIDKLIFAKQHTSVGSGFYHLGEIRSWTNNGYGGGLDFYTGKHTGGGNYAATFAMRIDGDGNVGIGTDAPERGLHVVGGIHLPNASAISFDQSSGALRNAILVDSGDDMIIGDTNFDDIYFSTGQKTKTVVIKQTTGNVGIGTDSPTSKLEVLVTQSDTMTDDTAAFAIKGNGGDGILMGQRATTPYAAWIAAGYLNNIGTSHNYPLALQPHGGNVGIGTTVPANLLTLKSGTNCDMEFGSESSGNFIQTYNRTSSAYGYLRFITGGTPAETMRLTADGKVGIGTTSPSYPLHIQTNDGTTNSTVGNILITNLSTGTTVPGFGGHIQFQAERNNGVNQNIGKIAFQSEVNAGTNISAGLRLYTSAAGTMTEKGRISWDGMWFVNGVRNYYQKVTLINSSTYTFDVPIEATGSGHTVYYECMYNHYGNDTYGARRMGFFSFRSLNNPTSTDHVVHSGGNSTTAGAWSVSMVGSGTSTPMMRFTKSAGSYSGTGQGYIHVRGGLPV